MKNQLKALSIFAFAILLTSCGDDDAPVLINEEEVITTVEYRLINTVDLNDVVVFTSEDADGDGPDAPVITVTGPLMANSTYEGSVRFLNTTVTPPEDITVEVVEEGLEHEVFYTSSLSSISVTKDDVDTANNPVGVQTTLNTGVAGTGDLTITLRHEPTKPNNNTLSGAGGETDVEVIFSVVVQ
jgi:hypothetical protein